MTRLNHSDRRTTGRHFCGFIAVLSCLSARVSLAACEYPIADLSTCPNRTPRSGYAPRANGCGPAGSALGTFLPQRYGAAQLLRSCDTHDLCYAQCNVQRNDCDAAFRRNLYAECDAVYPPSSPHNPLAVLSSRGCRTRARLYHQAVVSWGLEAYQAAQKEACECCRDDGNGWVYCSCNQRCYRNAASCVQECEVTLGCFTGICEPIEPSECQSH
jgi:hypothetical protein